MPSPPQEVIKAFKGHFFRDNPWGEGLIYFLWVGVALGRYPALDDHRMFQVLDSSVVMFPFTFVDAS